MRKWFALAVILVSSVALAPAPHATAATPASPLEGSWIVDLDVAPPLPMGQFVALETYSRGGGLVTTNDLDRAIGVDVGQGAWRSLGGHRYRISIQFFAFNADGSRAGTVEVSHTVRLTSAQTYVGEGVGTLRAIDGSIVASAPFTSAGRKLRANQF